MRDIIFRGKVSEDGTNPDKFVGMWIYGDLFHMGNIVAISPIETEEEIEKFLSGETEGKQLPTMVVIPETVGQDTTYANIYRGDIVLIPWYDDEADKDIYIKAEIIWKHGGWQCDPLPNHFLKKEPWAIWLHQEDGELPEVIGNVYDNPELLEENNV